MPRNTTFQNPQKQIVQTLEDQHKYDLPTMRRLDVNASVTNRMETPYVGSEAAANASNASRLVDALNAPELMKYLQVREADYNERENLRGQKEASAGNPSDITSKAFYEGYMKTKGYLGAMSDQEKMLKEWEETPKEGVTFDQWSQGWWQQNTAGLKDREYLAGYMPVMTQVFNKAQQKDAQDKLKDVIEKRDAGFAGVIKQAITEAKQKGIPFDMSAYEAIRGSVAGAGQGIDNKTANDITADVLMDMAKSVTTEEDMEVLKHGFGILKENHSDGTPGFAKWGIHADDILKQTQYKLDRTLQAEEDRKRTEERILKKELTEGFTDQVGDLIESNKDPMVLMKDEKYSMLDRTKMMSTIRRAQRVWKQTQDGTAPSFDAKAREALRDRIEKAQGDPNALQEIRMDAYATYQGKGVRQTLASIFATAKSPKGDVGYQDGLSFLADTHKTTSSFIGSDAWAPAKRDFQNRWEETYYMSGQDLALSFPKEIPDEFKGRPLYELPVPIKRKIGFALAEQYAPKKSASGSSVGTASRPLSGGSSVLLKGEAGNAPNGFVIKRLE